MSSSAPAEQPLLSVLSRAPAADVKTFAEVLLPLLTDLTVLRNRTGLVLLPLTDTVTGAAFYAGEILLAEAQVRCGTTEGYGACLGRDLEQALALAVIDAAARAGHHAATIVDFVTLHAAAQAAEDLLLLRQVAATCVEMETF